ncbi:MAG: hypothetical protein V1746_04860 [bacterium]
MKISMTSFCRIAAVGLSVWFIGNSFSAYAVTSFYVYGTKKTVLEKTTEKKEEAPLVYEARFQGSYLSENRRVPQAYREALQRLENDYDHGAVSADFYHWKKYKLTEEFQRQKNLRY